MDFKKFCSLVCPHLIMILVSATILYFKEFTNKMLDAHYYLFWGLGVVIVGLLFLINGHRFAVKRPVIPFLIFGWLVITESLFPLI